jgi:hypothetical protein
MGESNPRARVGWFSLLKFLTTTSSTFASGRSFSHFPPQFAKCQRTHKSFLLEKWHGGTERVVLVGFLFFVFFFLLSFFASVEFCRWSEWGLCVYLYTKIFLSVMIQVNACSKIVTLVNKITTCLAKFTSHVFLFLAKQKNSQFGVWVLKFYMCVISLFIEFS